MTLRAAMVATRNMGLDSEWMNGFNRSANALSPLCEHICFPGMNVTDLAGVDYASNRPGNGGKYHHTAWSEIVLVRVT